MKKSSSNDVNYKNLIVKSGNRYPWYVSLGIMTIILSLSDSHAAREEYYSLTGPEYLSTLKDNGYEIELVQIIDGKYKKKVPERNSAYLCQLSLKAELVLLGSKGGYDSLSCKLSVFKKNDKMTEGWQVARMQWKGDYADANFIVDPRNSSKPHFSVELRDRFSGKKPANRKRLRLLVVKLAGPPGQSWKQALGRSNDR